MKVWWVALWGIANVACFVLHFGTYACWFAAEGEECAPAPWAVCVAKGAGMALNLSCAFVVLPMCRIFLTLLRKVRILLEHIDECVRPASPLSDPTSTLYRCGSSAGWCRSTRVTTSTSSSAGRSPGGHRRPVERGRGAPPRSPRHRPHGSPRVPPSRHRWTLIHVVAHYINYAGLPDPSVMITSAAGATGHVLLLCLALMCVAALPRFRRGKHFHIFMKVCTRRDASRTRSQPAFTAHHASSPPHNPATGAPPLHHHARAPLLPRQPDVG